jgi:hypothetical protein
MQRLPSVVLRLLLVTSEALCPGCYRKSLWRSDCSHGSRPSTLSCSCLLPWKLYSASALHSQCCLLDADPAVDALQPTANAAVTLPTAKKRARAALPPEVAGMAAVQEQKARCPNSSTPLLSASITVGLHSQQV